MRIFKNKKLPRTNGGLWILIVAAVVFEATACIQYFYSRSAIKAEAEQRAMGELNRAELEFKAVAAEVEMSAKSMALMAEKNLNKQDVLFDILRVMVKNTPNMTGAGFTFDQNYYPAKGKWFEPYACEVNPGDKTLIRTEQIAGPHHDYFQEEWYQSGRKTDSCIWSEPYYDNSGARTMLVSCTYHVHDSQGQTVAVSGADVSLGRLQYIADYLQMYPESYYSITSAKGVQIVPLPELSKNKKYQSYTKCIDATGWTMTIIIPDEIIFGDLRRVGLIVSLLMLLGLILLVFIIYRAASNLINVVNLNNQKERVQSELNIARNIQMAMLPTRFPPFDDFPNLNAYGMVNPAKAIGGDLFDFYIRENKLFFCIGDVSGKGVPAALVMAVTRSLFRSFTSYLNSAAQIVSHMNASLTDDSNNQNMFVTLFIGILDLETGELQYCNAGHDAPIIISDGKLSLINCLPNLPIGVLAGIEYEEQQTAINAGDTLFLYTDGLTEAENQKHELFGMERIKDVLNNETSITDCHQLVDKMTEAVQAYVGSAEQSDDLTMFAIRFVNPSIPTNKRTLLTRCHHSLVMRNDIQQIPTLAEWIDSLGLPDELNMPINLALEEAVSNVMLYAYPESKSGQVLVEAEGDDDRIIFTISDSGIPFDPTQQQEPDLTLSAEDRPIGGLGIHLVKQIMSEVTYIRKNDKNILTLVKRL